MSRTTKTFILLMALTALVGSYAFIQQLNSKKAQVAEEAGRFALTEYTAEEITALQWSAGGEDFSFAWTDEAWVNADDPDFPVDQEAVQELAEAVAELEGTRKLENVENAGDYGLEEPAFTLTVQWTDDADTTYSLGDETPFGDSWYMSLSGEDGVVYTVEEDLSSDFDIALIDLAQPEDIPAVEEVTALTVGSAKFAKQDVSATLDPEQLWYADDGTPVSGDEVETLIDLCGDVQWSDIVATSATGEELTGWGLTDDAATTISLENAVGETLALMVGATDADGNYYTKLRDSAMVYTVAADDLTDLLAADAAAIAVADPIPLMWDHLSAMTFAIGDDEWQFARAETEASADSEAEDEDTAPALTVTLNGSEADADAAEALYALISGLAAGESADADGEEILAFTLENESGMTAAFTVHTCDVDNYAMTIDGDAAILVPADTIDKVIRSLKQF